MPTLPSDAPLPQAPPPLDSVTLQDCDAEPIHTPGHVQPHGALLAFDAGTLALRNWSENTAALLGAQPCLGMQLSAFGWHEAIAATVAEVQAEAATAQGFAPVRLVEDDCMAGFDVLVHAHAGRVMVEFERTGPEPAGSAAFVARAPRLLDALRRQNDVAALLNTAVVLVRQLTGHDRVMAYRFRHDDSGEVRAEARRDDLESLLGMRYPASDIPAQARRLYVLSTLRVIAHVDDRPVPVLGHPQDPPLDMSYGALRSVSPVHVEYLRNMGVQASMSISIVVDGKLWGLIACHHYAPHRPAYAVRAVCDLVAQVVAAQVARLESAARAAAIDRVVQLRTRLADELQQYDDVLAGFEPQMAELASALEADAMLATLGGRVLTHGKVSAEQAHALLQGLPADATELERHERSQWPDAVQQAIGPWVGALGVAFDLQAQGWLVALRTEQEHTVRWGGAPGKHYAEGPRGPRLSPRGSFAEWRQTVQGEAVPWPEPVRLAAHHLQSDLQREVLARHGDVERARVQMLAMLSHDLRDPLNTIRMAAGALEKSPEGAGLSQRIGQRIRSSSGRMERLVTHLLDFSRIRGGRGLDVKPAEGDLVALLRDLVDEVSVAHPGSTITLDAPPQVLVRFDTDRMSQAVGNLLSNARHHGDPQQPVVVRVRPVLQGGATIDVRNPAPPLPREVADNLFQAFKRQTESPQPSRHRGLGLGLFIAHRTASEHGGQLDYRHEDGDVVFTITLPA